MHFWKNCKLPFNLSCRLPAWLLGTVLGLFFLVLGSFYGQFDVLWRKAVMICMECIGIG